MKKPVNRVKRKENLAGWAFIAPTMIAFLILTALPFFIALFLSFAQVSYFKGWDTLKIVGFQNFIDIFQDKNFVTSLGNTFVYVVTIVPLSIILSLVFAYCMNGRIYGKKFLRMAFFIPYISSIVAVGTVFKFLFREDGIINNILINLHILSQPIKWAMDPRFSKVPIILLSVWASIGYQLILFTAAMQNVPVSLYEAAKLDGAGSFRQFWSITLPPPFSICSSPVPWPFSRSSAPSTCSPWVRPSIPTAPWFWKFTPLPSPSMSSVRLRPCLWCCSPLSWWSRASTFLARRSGSTIKRGGGTT